MHYQCHKGIGPGCVLSVGMNEEQHQEMAFLEHFLWGSGKLGTFLPCGASLNIQRAGQKQACSCSNGKQHNNE